MKSPQTTMGLKCMRTAENAAIPAIEEDNVWQRSKRSLRGRSGGDCEGCGGCHSATPHISTLHWRSGAGAQESPRAHMRQKAAP
ncbi:hypothetical protein BASA83_013086 [Batrachochytrium salamandrivorans]|nr:hypothetical protein BASA83_013086 [Batrachochytrium salamandrivorans]